MDCPYRINQKVEKHYRDFQANDPYLDVEHYYAECNKRSCPWYYEDRETFSERCLQVDAELTKAGLVCYVRKKYEHDAGA